MKLFSVIKLAFHNLANNKLRTLLTTVVLTVMATIIMVLATLSISYINSSNATISSLLKKQGTDLTLQNVEFTNEGEYYSSRDKEYSVQEIDEILQDLDGGQKVFNNISLSSNRGNSYDMYLNGSTESSYIYTRLTAIHNNYNLYYVLGEDYLLEGRLWGKEEDLSGKIWINSSVYYNNKMQLGDKIGFGFSDEEFEIVGVIDSESSYMDYKYFDGQASDSWSSNDSAPYISTITCDIVPQEGVEYGQDLIDKLEGFIDKYNKADYVKGISGIQANSSIIDELKYARIIYLVFLAVVIVVSIMIILLSIGSVNNTIKITVEQNRKFFGMMKAIGMRNNSVSSIVRWQAFIMVIVAVLISYLINFAFLSPLESVIGKLMSTYGSEAIIMCSIPFYIPFVIAGGLIIAILLATLSSLRKISKMDVISVISEVE